MDRVAVQRAASGLVLALPRGPQRGRAGSRRAATVGSSIEVHDWRGYQPGDDVRSVDWNAVARTGELIVRLREDEVSPRVEVVVDASQSMAISAAKEARTREIALLLCEVAQRQGLTTTLRSTSARPDEASGSGCAHLAGAFALDARDDLVRALRRAPPLRRCGLRVVVSDFLFEAPLNEVTAGLARGAGALALVQVLAREDAEPEGGFGARLVDAETDETLEHLLSPDVLERYRQRFAAHATLLRESAQRVRALLQVVVADAEIEALARGALSPLVGPAHAGHAWL